MKTNNRQVAHIWAQGNGVSAQGSNFRCEDNKLYSYRTLIAFIDVEKKVVFISNYNFSMTTAKHLSYARSALFNHDYKIFYAGGFNYGYYFQHDTPAQLIQDSAKQQVSNFEALLKKRKPDVVSYETRSENIKELAKLYKVKICKMPICGADMKAVAATYRAEKERQEKLAAKKRLKAIKEQQKLDKETLETWLTTGNGYFPASFKNYQSAMLTLFKDTVCTSLGADVPLEHVKRALEFYDLKRWPYHTNGHKIHLGHFVLDSIDEHGNVKAGCHNITASEIERFRKQWGL